VCSRGVGVKEKGKKWRWEKKTDGIGWLRGYLYLGPLRLADYYDGGGVKPTLMFWAEL
jgi:hypothetical protein